MAGNGDLAHDMPSWSRPARGPRMADGAVLAHTHGEVTVCPMGDVRLILSSGPNKKCVLGNTATIR